jgi:hypothetical protein
MAPERELVEYLQRLSAVDPDDAGAFHSRFKEGMELLDLRAVDLCEQFDVTVPTVRHWRAGETAPHPAVRRLVLDYLAECVGGRGVQLPQQAVASNG